MEWPKKGDKWIFTLYTTYNTGIYEPLLGGTLVFEDWYWTDERGNIIKSEECWDKFGGRTENYYNEYNNYKWKCDKCGKTSKTFIDFIEGMQKPEKIYDSD